MEYLLYYMPPTPNKIWEDKGNKTKQISVKSQASFYVKAELQHI